MGRRIYTNCNYHALTHFLRFPPRLPPPLQSLDCYLSLDYSRPLVNWKVQTPMFYNIDQVIEGLKDLFRSELVEIPR